jgi:hypothetical protein
VQRTGAEVAALPRWGSRWPASRGSDRRTLLLPAGRWAAPDGALFTALSMRPLALGWPEACDGKILSVLDEDLGLSEGISPNFQVHIAFAPAQPGRTRSTRQFASTAPSGLPVPGEAPPAPPSPPIGAATPLRSAHPQLLRRSNPPPGEPRRRAHPPTPAPPIFRLLPRLRRSVALTCPGEASARRSQGRRRAQRPRPAPRQRCTGCWRRRARVPPAGGRVTAGQLGRSRDRYCRAATVSPGRLALNVQSMYNEGDGSSGTRS